MFSYREGLGGEPQAARIDSTRIDASIISLSKGRSSATCRVSRLSLTLPCKWGLGVESLGRASASHLKL